MTHAAPLQLIEPEVTPDYPFGGDNLLPGAHFVKWEFGRWLTSDMWLHAEPEVGYAYLALIFKSQLSRPVGTIPADAEGQVALLENKWSLPRWRALLRCDPSPLHGWRRYRCDGGGIRLGHQVVIDMIHDQLARRDQTAVRREGEAHRKRIDRIRAAFAERGISQAVLRDQTLMERIDGWITENCRGRRDFRAYDRALMAAVNDGIIIKR